MTSWILLGASGLLGAILAWGLVSPRTQWRVLVGWSTSDPDRAEPGDGVHGVTRLICLIGLLGLGAFAGVQIWSLVSHQPRPAAAATDIERMWGTPVPRLVDRAVTPLAEPPTVLVSGPIVAFQEIERGWAPDYLVEMPRWSYLGEPEPVGLIGVYPGDGYTGYGISDILVAASGPLGCIPRVAAVAEDETEIRIGVYWGLPGGADQDHLGACDATAAMLQTVLVPVQLAAPVERRDVVTFDGVPVAPVAVVDE